MQSTRCKPGVVITGIGLVTPFGDNKTRIARAVSTGETATRWLDEQPPLGTKNPGLFAGAAARYRPRFGEDPVVEMALQSAEQAVADGGIDPTVVDPHRIGTVIGTSKGSLASYAERFMKNRLRDESAPRSVVYPGFEPNTPALKVAQHLNLGGPCLCPIAACATGLQSISRGVDLITDGYCDVVLAGSSDASICDWVLSSFNRLGVLAKNFTDPSRAIRPFDETRDGFLVGEGAAVLVLERTQHAAARSANIYAEWLGSISGADPTGVTQIDESGTILASLIQRLLTETNLSPDEIDFLNLHGTATIPNDLCEANAIRSVFGSRPIPASSFKAQIGHCLGAAGSIELAISLLANQAPTQVNLTVPIDQFPPTVAARPFRVQLKTSLGFGGHLNAAILASAK